MPETKEDRFDRLRKGREERLNSSNVSKTDIINKIIGTDSESRLISNTSTEQTEASVTLNTDTEQTQATLTKNTDDEHSNVSVTSNSNTEQSNVSVDRKTASPTRIPKPIEEFEKRLKKPTVEETHTRGTWLIRNDLLKRLEKLSKHQQRGFKTYVVNYALERILDELEGK